jgi:aspartyl-tRNA synthetase
VRSEWCIRIDGEVKARDDALVNPKIPTGEIEVFIRDMEVLGAAEELPLMVFGEQEYPEETRLKYRYLDLRRAELHDNIMLRSRVVQDLRQRMWDQGFTEFQTPIITASSPEGARDFLVPSRLHPGKFYALPQAPQQFKQLIMCGGFDKYFQIAPCFRDEDPRADRAPTDFYQLDMEMSFVEQDDVFHAIQPAVQGSSRSSAAGKVGGYGLAAHLLCRRGAEVVRHRQARPAQPDQDAGRLGAFRGSGFAIFAKLLEHEGTEVRAIPRPRAAAAASSATG